MKFAIQINSDPARSQGAYSAYRFIQAALAGGHAIVCAFFYHDGVYNGMGSVPSGAETGSAPNWSGLAKSHGIDLVLCVSAAERRGIVPAESVMGAQIDECLAEGFRIGGLGQWTEACLRADRVLVFGD